MSWLRYAAGAALAAVMGLAGCSKTKKPHADLEPAPGVTASRERPAAPAPRGPYNVVLIMIDSLRADMPWAGYSRPVAPWLTAFATKSTLYPRAYSISSYTAKSVVPALVGKYPSEMPRDGYFFTLWPGENLFVSERAQKAGHRTLAGHAHGYFKPIMGLAQGFDDYRLLPGTELDVTGVANVTSDLLNALAKKMLSNESNTRLAKGKCFFAYFHFLDPHFTYFKHQESPDWGSDVRALYDNEVHYTDRWVGDLVDWSLKQAWAKDTAIIITADHGEGFGERGRFRHAYDVWESLVRVPLFIYVPGADARRIEVSRGAIDLAPTIAALMGLPAEPPFRGKSLVGEVFGEEAKPRPIVVDLPRSDIMDRRRAVIDGDWKIIAMGDDSSWLLFDVKQDPKEENDLSAKEPERFLSMKKLYQKLSSEIPVVPVDGKGPGLLGAPRGQRW